MTAGECIAATGGRPFDPAKPAVVCSCTGRACDHTGLAAAGALVRLAWPFAALAVDLPGHGRSEGQPLPGSVAELGQWLAPRASMRPASDGAALVGRLRWAVRLRWRRLPRSAAARQPASRFSARLLPIPVNAELLSAAREAPRARLPDDDGVVAWVSRAKTRRPSGPGPVDDRRQPWRCSRATRRACCATSLAACAAWTSGAGRGRTRALPGAGDHGRQRHH